MSNTNFMITEESVQGVNVTAKALLSLSECYKLPKAVNLMIEELNDRTESLESRYYVGNELKAVNA